MGHLKMWALIVFDVTISISIAVVVLWLCTNSVWGSPGIIRLFFEIVGIGTLLYWIGKIVNWSYKNRQKDRQYKLALIEKEWARQLARNMKEEKERYEREYWEWDAKRWEREKETKTDKNI